jgi:hypothetical protein
MKNILLAFFATLALSVPAAADELIILNSGSKTGSFSMTSIAYYTDLMTEFDNIQLINPGNRCVALNSILPRLDGPVLMPWASDYEAEGRDGGCATFDISQGHVIRYNAEPMNVCHMGGLDVTVNSGRIGHTVPVNGPLSRAAGAINDNFGTEHTNVAYDGQGDTRLALINGEIDYALLAREHAAYVESNGGICNYNLSNDPESSLYSLANNNTDLVFGFDNVWLGLNMTPEQAADLQETLIAAHNNCESASAQYTGCGELVHILWDLTTEQALERWESVVESQRAEQQ